MVHDPRFTTHGQRNRHCLQSRYIVSVRCGSRACFCISVASHDFTARRDGRAESPARKAVDIRSTSAHTLYTAAYANSKSNCIRLYTNSYCFMLIAIPRTRMQSAGIGGIQNRPARDTDADRTHTRTTTNEGGRSVHGTRARCRRPSTVRVRSSVVSIPRVNTSGHCTYIQYAPVRVRAPLRCYARRARRSQNAYPEPTRPPGPAALIRRGLSRLSG